MLENVTPAYINLQYPDGIIAARFDPVRGILELQRRGIKHFFDLAQVIKDQKNNSCTIEKPMLE